MMVLEWSVKKMLPLHLADVYTVHFSITIPLSSLQSFTGPSPFCLSGCFSFSLLCAHFFFSRFEADEPGDNDTAPLYASYHSDDRWLPRCASSWEALECVCVEEGCLWHRYLCVFMLLYDRDWGEWDLSESAGVSEKEGAWEKRGKSEPWRVPVPVSEGNSKDPLIRMCLSSLRRCLSVTQSSEKWT